MKYLILGDGRLASELIKQTEWDFISRKKDGIDFTDIHSYNTYLDEYEQIINCIGYTKTYENNKKDNWDINYLGVIDLVDYCKLNKTKLIHISTDYVYANSISNASEEDVPSNFNTWYSYTKLLGDGYVQAKLEDYLLLRTNFKPRPFQWTSAWDDIKGNFDYVDIISKMIIELIKKEALGVYNVGTESKTYYDLAIQTLPNCKRDYSKTISRPTDITMNLKKINDEI